MRRRNSSLAPSKAWRWTGRALLAGALSGSCAFVVGGEWKAVALGVPFGCFLELRSSGRASARPLAQEIVAGALVGSIVLALRRWGI